MEPVAEPVATDPVLVDPNAVVVGQPDFIVVGPDPIGPSLGIMLPEIVMAAGALSLLMAGVFLTRNASRTVTGLSIALLVIIGLWLTLFAERGVAFGGAYLMDEFAVFMKVLAVIGSVTALAMSAGTVQGRSWDRFEYPVLIVLATTGMMLMISANDLIALYLGLEMQSLALYVVASINRDNVRSTEAGLKYFVLGALSSGMLLYGASLVYGFTGQTNFVAIAEALVVEERGLGVVFGLAFVMAGLAFKISAVPFHMWTPDVYEGAPTPVTAFLAAAPKVAAMALTVRVVIDAFAPLTVDWQQIVVFIAIASMVLGSFAAIGQRNIKRLMAYSSIGHMGYALVGLSAGTAAGVRGVLIYMLVYLVMTLGTFACILAMENRDGPTEDIDDLAGISRTSPFMAVMMTLLMFSLAGIPPLAGFVAKYAVFVAAVEAELYGLAVIGVLASVVGAFYYLRIVKIMWFDEPAESFLPMAGELRVVGAAAGVFMVGYVVVELIASPFGEAATLAARSLF